MNERSKWLVFTILSLLFLGNQYLEYKGIYIEFLFSYLDDLVALPICMFLADRINSLFNKKGTIKFWMVAVTILYFSIAFEWYFPKEYPAKFTTDFIDVICYTVGGLFYFFLLRKSEVSYGIK